jgi:hypothetical protein
MSPVQSVSDVTGPYRRVYPPSPATPLGVFSNSFDAAELRARIWARVLRFRRLNLNILQRGELAAGQDSIRGWNAKGLGCLSQSSVANSGK